MKLGSIKAAMPLAILMLVAGTARASESTPAEAGSSSSVSQRVGHVAVRALDATRHGIEHGVEATVRGVKRGAQAAGHGVETGANAVGRVAHRVAEKF